MIKTLMFILIVVAFSSENYQKNYYDTGELKSEGWLKNGKKVNYWFYYYPNGALESKGHFNNDNKTDYWYHYNVNGKKTEEGHYRNGQKNGWWKIYKKDTIIEVRYKDSQKKGLAIFKVKGQPVKAEYYKNGIKTNEWFNLQDFKKEYPLVNE